MKLEHSSQEGTLIDDKEYKHLNKRILLLKQRLRQKMAEEDFVSPFKKVVRKAHDNLSGYDIIRGTPLCFS